jgi:hypothetical protein
LEERVAPVSAHSSKGGTPQSLQRQKFIDIALENFVAVEEISRLRIKVLELERERERERSHRPPREAPARGTRQVPPEGHHFDALKSVSLRSPQRQLVVEAATSSRDAVDRKDYNDMMINRLRRAMAPPPTKEQLGEVVHAMVTEMVRQLNVQGVSVPLKRVDHCQYQLNKRKLHLTVDSGRLVVKAGGGHVDLLEFLERNKLCTTLAK